MTLDAERIWLQAQVPAIEAAVLRSLALGWKDPWLKHDDQDAASKDLERLRGGNCHYDHPLIGVLYAAKYHAKRVHQALRVLHPLLVSPTHVDLIDLGSGTGSTLWAAALICLAAHHSSRELSIRITECDASPQMLRQAELLWKCFREQWPEVNDLVERKIPQYCSWSNIAWESNTRPILIASHLLHEDDATNHTHELPAAINHVADTVDATQVITWHIRKKQHVLSAAVGDHWRSSELTPTDPIPSPSEPLSSIADWWNTHIRLRSHAGYWNDTFLCVNRWELRGKPTQLLLASNGRTWIPSKAQATAATIPTKHMLVQGAAGTGKTLVLAQRLKYLLKTGAKNVLVVAFNKEVVRLLGKYINDMGVDVHYSINLANKVEWTIRNSLNGPNQRLVATNFDSLPWRYNVVKGPVKHIDIPYTVRHDIRFSQLLKKYDPEFLTDEFRLIIYGRCGCLLSEYLKSSSRRGRGEVSLDTATREAIFEAFDSLFNFESLATSSKIPVEPTTLYHARYCLRFAMLLEDRRFTHILVDEAQDFTRADWISIKRLATDDSSWSICWDRTQAVHTGSTFDTPRTPLGLSSVAVTTLLDAYRVPRPIVHVAKFLAQGICPAENSEDDEYPTIASPTLTAVPGPRPVLIRGSTPDQCYHNLRNVLVEWTSLRPDLIQRRAFIGEFTGSGSKAADIDWKSEENKVRKTFVETGWSARDILCGSVRKYKGTEFSIVTWMAHWSLGSMLSWNETLYTLLTRTTGLLLIVAPQKGLDVMTTQLLEKLRQEADGALVRTVGHPFDKE
jgi:hypothetical protein